MISFSFVNLHDVFILLQALILMVVTARISTRNLGKKTHYVKVRNLRVTEWEKNPKQNTTQYLVFLVLWSQLPADH